MSLEENKSEENGGNGEKVNRRQFLLGIAAIFGMKALSACDGGVSPVRCKKEAIIDTPNFSIEELKNLLAERYPSLRFKSEDGTPKYNFRAIATESDYENDDLVQSYLRQASYADLLADNIVNPTDMIEKEGYLNPSNMWRKKIRKACRNHKKDCKIAMKNCKPFKVGSETLQSFMSICKTAETRVKAKAIELSLDSPFIDVIDADLLLGISIHEIIPTGYTESVRIALLRTLFEEGLEINKIPAIYDDVASFGPVQMSVIPYEGRTRRNPYDDKGVIGEIEPFLDDFGLPSKLHDCINLEDQMVAAMLLQLKNMKWLFNHKLLSSLWLMELWKTATDLEKRSFIATLLGTAHNNPRNAKKTIQKVIALSGKDFRTLDELRIAFVKIAIKRHKVSGNHGDKTGSLVARFSKYGMGSTTGQLPVEGHNRYKLAMYEREKQGKMYYTYTLPNWRLDYVLKLLCGHIDDKFIQQIKTFNNIDRFKPGDVILIPVEELKTELRNPALEEVQIPQGLDTKNYLLKLFNGDTDKANLAVLYSAKDNVSGLDEIGNIIRLPKAMF